MNRETYGYVQKIQQFVAENNNRVDVSDKNIELSNETFSTAGYNSDDNGTSKLLAISLENDGLYFEVSDTEGGCRNWYVDELEDDDIYQIYSAL